jgi:hypothetical protein
MLLKFCMYKRLGRVHIYSNSALAIHFTGYHEENIISFVVWLVAVIFVRSHLSSKSLFGRECWEQLSIFIEYSRQTALQ